MPAARGGYPVAEKYKASGPADLVQHDSVAFDGTATDKELTYVPNGIYLQADEDCWVRFDGTDATAALPCLQIVKNVLYGPFNFGRGGDQFSVIRDTQDGTLAIIYGLSYRENDLDADPNE